MTSASEQASSKPIPEELHRLLVWVAENLEAEPLSGILPGGPVWNVNVERLLDQIAASWGVSKEALGAVVNPAREAWEVANGR